MYTEQDERRLYEQAKHLLKENSEHAEETISQLREVINYADWKYYVQSEPVLSDAEYDALFKKLKHLEDKNPELVSADSPTQRVAQGLSERFPTVSILVPNQSFP